MSWTVGTKIAAGFVIPLAILVVVAAWSYHSIDLLVDAAEERRQSFQTIDQFSDVLSLLKDVETGQRGFVITGDSSYLQPYQTALRGDDDRVVMTVSDNGIGITAEALPHVFEPFMQEPHVIGLNGVGLGIGLTVVRELVGAHGGEVVADSAGSGLGSRFVVTLPRSRVATPPALETAVAA